MAETVCIRTSWLPPVYKGLAFTENGCNNSALSPLVAASQFATTGAQMYQMHRGFTAVQAGLQTLQTSVGVLQATTAVIGVGVTAGIALAAVNLYQTLKLRKQVGQLRLEVNNSFIDLKQALRDQGAEIKQLIEQVAQDVEFKHHRTILVQAYGLFTQALHRLNLAMQLQDVNRRNAEIDAVRGMLFESLKDYANPHLLEETCAAGHLRRLECSWAIKYKMSYQLLAIASLTSKIKSIKMP